MGQQAAGKTYLVVLVPSDQATTEGCPPGFVKLTGTPGAGSWDEWGPYACAAEVTDAAFGAVTGIQRLVPAPGEDPGVPALPFG